MTAPPREGKISPSFFRREVANRLGHPRSDVVVGPSTGVDVGVVRWPRRGVLLATTDPLYLEPSLGWDRAAWFAFHIVASDLTTTGRRPDWVTVDLDLPPDAPDAVLRTVLRVFDRESKHLGAAIVTGHTGRYSGCRFPMVGSATMLAWAPERGYLTTREIPVGARLLVVGTAALEATAMLSVLHPDRIRDGLGGPTLRAAGALIPRMSTVPAALRAAGVGLREEGVWAMHDATEGGVRAAAWEMALASRRGLAVDLRRVPVDPAVRAVCDLFGIPTLDASSEGTLLVAAEPRRAAEVTETLARGGFPVAEVGEFVPHSRGVRDRGRPFRPAPRDSYSAALQRLR